MDSSTAVQPQAASAVQINGNESLVDSFLVEALQNPRHRLTILRMELDIQRFLQSSELKQFEFQHFPTSYLRLAAHRVAQHYGLVTMVQDNGVDGLVNKIVAIKTAEGRYPSVCLSDIPAKQLDGDKPEKVKIAIRPRPNQGSADQSNESGGKRNHVRSVEERKEEYDRARARIFSSPSSPNSDDALSQDTTDKGLVSSIKDETESWRNFMVDPANIRDCSSSRVAIFRDREKDRYDPDYDRSYDRYVRGALSNQSFNMLPFSAQVPYIQYDPGFPQPVQMSRNQSSFGYMPAANPVFNPYFAVGSNQTSHDAAHARWPSASMMYAHSYDQFRHAVFQAPFCQQPLTFDHSQNH